MVVRFTVRLYHISGQHYLPLLIVENRLATRLNRWWHPGKPSFYTVPSDRYQHLSGAKWISIIIEWRYTCWDDAHDKFPDEDSSIFGSTSQHLPVMAPSNIPNLIVMFQRTDSRPPREEIHFHPSVSGKMRIIERVWWALDAQFTPRDITYQYKRPNIRDGLIVPSGTNLPRLSSAQ